MGRHTIKSLSEQNMKNWFKRIVLEAAWKVDGICHRIIEKLDPIPDEKLHDAIQLFRNTMEARKVAHELDKKKP